MGPRWVNGASIPSRYPLAHVSVGVGATGKSVDNMMKDCGSHDGDGGENAGVNTKVSEGID